jgi:hypothetical protein
VTWMAIQLVKTEIALKNCEERLALPIQPSKMGSDTKHTVTASPTMQDVRGTRIAHSSNSCRPHHST